MDLKHIEQRLNGCLQMLENAAVLPRPTGAADGTDQFLLSSSEHQAVLELVRRAIDDLREHRCASSSSSYLLKADVEEADYAEELDDLESVDTDYDEEDDEPLIRRKRRKRKPAGRKAGQVKKSPYSSTAEVSAFVDGDEGGEGRGIYTISPTLKELLVWINNLPSCYRKGDRPLPSDFDILRGKKFDHYGLHSQGSWRQELALLLLRFPNFRHPNYIFFAQIFQQTAQIWRQKVVAYEKLFKNEPMAKYNWKYCSKEKSFIAQVLDPILKGHMDYGLLEEDGLLLQEKVEVKPDWVHNKPSEDFGTLDELTGELVPTKRKVEEEGEEGANTAEDEGVRPAKLLRLDEVKAEIDSEDDDNDDNAECDDSFGVGDMSNFTSLPLGIIKAKVLKTFGTMQYYGYKRFILPELKTRNCVALLAVSVDSRGKCSAKVIVNHCESEKSNPALELIELVNLLTRSLGMSKRAVYKWKEMVPKGEGYAYRKYQPKKDRSLLLKSSAEHRRERLRHATEDFKPYEDRLPHNLVQELPAQTNEVVEIELVEAVDWNDVNNVSILLGRGGGYSVKTLFNSECQEKFIREAETCKTHTSQKLNHSQFCRTMLEVFKYLTNTESKELVSRFEQFGKEFRTIRSKWNILKDLEDMQETINKQCNYCGKVFECHTTTMDGQSISLHIKKCRLEKANCDCSLTFSSPREKRHHMLLKHSGVTYLECSQCHYLTQRQDALDNHVEYFHGFPGREETCDLCYKSFRSRYHLSIHQFTHECHFCAHCQREFLGRLPFRNHMKNEHGAGHGCDLCGKVMATKIELDKHKKLTHADKSWMNS